MPRFSLFPTKKTLGLVAKSTVGVTAVTIFNLAAHYACNDWFNLSGEAMFTVQSSIAAGSLTALYLATYKWMTDKPRQPLQNTKALAVPSLPLFYLMFTASFHFANGIIKGDLQHDPQSLKSTGMGEYAASLALASTLMMVVLVPLRLAAEWDSTLEENSNLKLANSTRKNLVITVALGLLVPSVTSASITLLFAHFTTASNFTLLMLQNTSAAAAIGMEGVIMYKAIFKGEAWKHLKYFSIFNTASYFLTFVGSFHYSNALIDRNITEATVSFSSIQNLANLKEVAKYLAKNLTATFAATAVDATMSVKACQMSRVDELASHSSEAAGTPHNSEISPLLRPAQQPLCC